MKIGYVLDDTLDSTDGVQQYVLTLGAWMSSQGHEVHYIVGQTTRTDIQHLHSLSRNLKVRFNGNRMTIPLPASRSRVRQLLLSQQYDVLHVQMPFSPWLAGRVIAAAPMGTRIVATFHIAPHSRFVGRATAALSWLTRRAVERIDVVISVSTAAQRFALRTYGVQSRLLPNVVDIRRFQTAEALDITDDCPRIMFLGRLVPRKGCQDLLRAIVVLRASHSRLKYGVLICGRGPLETDLRAFVNDNGLQDCIQFTGFVSEDEKAGYLKSSDIAVFPSTGGESFGIVLLEAMAANHPAVLAADNEGYAAVLEKHPESLFPAGDSDVLAAKLAELLTQKAAIPSRTAWQNIFVRQFDISTVGDSLQSVYNRPIK